VPPALRAVVATLEKLYPGTRPPPVRTPFEAILHENAGYLVDDARRDAVFAALKKSVGTTPEKLLAAPRAALLAALEEGGMQPQSRAEKLVRAARIAFDLGEDLAAVARRPLADALRVLRAFPGMGRAGAERLVLLAGAHPVLALESNGLRVLVRLGFAAEQKSYDATYRAVRAAVDPEVPAAPARVLRAHLLLRRHGQELCRRSAPRCAICPLAPRCDWARARSPAV
jgi:endonuclease III